MGVTGTMVRPAHRGPELAIIRLRCRCSARSCSDCTGASAGRGSRSYYNLACERRVGERVRYSGEVVHAVFPTRGKASIRESAHGRVSRSRGNCFLLVLIDRITSSIFARPLGSPNWRAVNCSRPTTAARKRGGAVRHTGIAVLRPAIWLSGDHCSGASDIKFAPLPRLDDVAMIRQMRAANAGVKFDFPGTTASRR